MKQCEKRSVQVRKKCGYWWGEELSGAMRNGAEVGATGINSPQGRQLEKSWGTCSPGLNQVLLEYVGRRGSRTPSWRPQLSSVITQDQPVPHVDELSWKWILQPWLSHPSWCHMEQRQVVLTKPCPSWRFMSKINHCCCFESPILRWLLYGGR